MSDALRRSAIAKAFVLDMHERGVEKITDPAVEYHLAMLLSPEGHPRIHGTSDSVGAAAREGGMAGPEDGFVVERLCGEYLGDNDGTCPQLVCIRRRGHDGSHDNVQGDPRPSDAKAFRTGQLVTIGSGNPEHAEWHHRVGEVCNPHEGFNKVQVWIRGESKAYWFMRDEVYALPAGVTLSADVQRYECPRPNDAPPERPVRECRSCGKKTVSTSTIDRCVGCGDDDGLRPRHFLTRDKPETPAAKDKPDCPFCPARLVEHACPRPHEAKAPHVENPEEDEDLLGKALRYVNLHHPVEDDDMWREHDAEVIALVELLRPARAPSTGTDYPIPSREIAAMLRTLAREYFGDDGNGQLAIAMAARLDEAKS